MNQAVREELLGVLAAFGDHAPDVRFGQLIANLAFLARTSGPSDIWDVEDEELLDVARSHLHDLKHRGETVPAESRA